MSQFIFLAVAGALGTLCRYSLSGIAQRMTGSGFPYGTLLVNILGSILIGFIMQASLSSEVIPRSLKLVITVGFLGAFTTFSTFSYETVRYLEGGNWLPGIINITANIGLGVLATLSGILLGRMTFGGA